VLKHLRRQGTPTRAHKRLPDRMFAVSALTASRFASCRFAASTFTFYRFTAIPFAVLTVLKASVLHRFGIAAGLKKNVVCWGAR